MPAGTLRAVDLLDDPAAKLTLDQIHAAEGLARGRVLRIGILICGELGRRDLLIAGRRTAGGPVTVARLLVLLFRLLLRASRAGGWARWRRGWPRFRRSRLPATMPKRGGDARRDAEQVAEHLGQIFLISAAHEALGDSGLGECEGQHAIGVGLDGGIAE